MKTVRRPAMLNARKERLGVWNVVLIVVLAVIFAALLFEAWFMQNYTPVYVDGDSMNNTLVDGDWLYTKNGATPKRGDIVTIDVHGYTDAYGRPLFPATVIIKRVVGLEGDAVKCEEGVVYLRYAGTEDFVVPSEPYALGSPDSDFAAVEVGKGQMFVMGDNRFSSLDSTEKGCLLVKDVLGVVPQWALENKTIITRWERFRDGLRTAFGGSSKN